MRAWKARLADLIFGVQLVCGITLCTANVVRFLRTTQGVSLGMLICMDVFMLVSLVLVTRAHRIQPSRVTQQTRIALAVYLVGIAVDIIALLFNGSYHWGYLDTMTLVSSGATTIVAAAYFSSRRVSLVSPLMLAWVAIAFKATPQLYQAVKISAEGNQGTAGLVLAMGHVTACIRLTQLFLACREAPHEKNRRGAFIAELANEFTWILVTAAWFVR